MSFRVHTTSSEFLHYVIEFMYNLFVYGGPGFSVPFSDALQQVLMLLLRVCVDYLLYIAFE